MLEFSQEPRVGVAPREPSAGEAALPGLWPAALAAALSGVCCWIWLTSQTAPMPASENASSGAAAISELAQVDDSDLAGALSTMRGPRGFLEQFELRDGGGRCAKPLAWVSLAAAPGQPPTRIRLRSGGYISPLFALSAAPVRVAIPYPSPYETGEGLLTVMHEGGDAIVSLVPSWPVAGSANDQTREVVWHPAGRCSSGGGGGAHG